MQIYRGIRCGFPSKSGHELPRLTITVFADAPHILQPEDLFGNEPTEPEATSDPLKDPSAVVRGWWKSADKTKTASAGLEDSLAVLRDLLKGAAEEGKEFDGVFGFRCDISKIYYSPFSSLRVIN